MNNVLHDVERSLAMTDFDRTCLDLKADDCDICGILDSVFDGHDVEFDRVDDTVRHLPRRVDVHAHVTGMTCQISSTHYSQ